MQCNEQQQQHHHHHRHNFKFEAKLVPLSVHAHQSVACCVQTLACTSVYSLSINGVKDCNTTDLVSKPITDRHLSQPLTMLFPKAALVTCEHSVSGVHCAMCHAVSCCVYADGQEAKAAQAGVGLPVAAFLKQPAELYTHLHIMTSLNLVAQAGSLEIFLNSLPGFPDGVSRASDGNFWVAINSAPLPKVWGVLMGSRVLRWMVGWVPNLAGELHAYGLILKVLELAGMCMQVQSHERTTRKDVKWSLARGLTSCNHETNGMQACVSGKLTCKSPSA